MKSALDTNVIAYLFADEPRLSKLASDILGEARIRGALTICGAVYAELLAHPKLTELTLGQFLTDTGIDIDFEAGRDIWHEVGRRYSRYSKRRRSQAHHPRRLLADFIIGAHALLQADRLITFDAQGYRDFPELRIIPAKPQ